MHSSILDMFGNGIDQQFTFFGDSMPHGDQQHREFLRGTPYHPTQSDQPSLLAIILLTDKDDCSAGAKGNLDFLEHPETAPKGIAEQPPNLRCYYDDVNQTGYKYPVERYIDAFKALRPGYEQLVVFAAIAGIPTDMKMRNFDANADGSIDSQEREVFYDALFSHSLMQPTIAEDGQNLNPACQVITQSTTPPPDVTEYEIVAKAYPARRLAEVARGFGENGIIESLCQADFSAVETIVKAMAKHFGSP